MIRYITLLIRDVLKIIMDNLLNINSKTLKVSMDLGKNEVKAFSFTEHGNIKKVVNFDSILKRNLTSHVLMSNSNPNKYKVEFEGKKYELGDGLEKGVYSNENSKVNFHHRLCLLVSVALLIEHDGQKVDILVGLPSSHISNSSERKAFEELLKGEEGKSISIIINNEIKNFTINSITPDSEGLAILPRLKMMLNNNVLDIAVIDIGGHNFNLRLFDPYGYSLDEKGISEEQVGINTLFNNLHLELISNLKNRDRKISRNDLKRFIKKQNLDMDMELSNYNGSNSEFINEFVENYIQEYIADKLSSYSIKINAKGMKYLFTGGGSSLLRPYIESMYSNNLDCIVFSDTSKWDNCISFAINKLFKINPNKAQIFSTMNTDALKKLSNNDKGMDNSDLEELKSIILGARD